MRRPEILIDDMIRALESIRERHLDSDPEVFAQDETDLKATLFDLITLGEAAKKLDDDFRKRYPGVPWSQATATRDFLAHGYYRVEAAIIHAIVFRDLPALEVELKRIREELS